MLLKSDSQQRVDEYLRRVDLRHRYKIGEHTVYDWMKRRGFPTPYKLGPKLVRWKLSECIAWEEQRKEGEV